MPKASGTSSRHERVRASGPGASLPSMYAVATPETRKRSASRHGLVRNISGSIVDDAAGLFTCQSHDT